MRTLLVAVVLGVSIALLGAPTALAADEPGQADAVSADTLAQMGMAGMSTVSDRKGEQVRGQGMRIFMRNMAFIWSSNTFVSQRITVGPRRGVYAVSAQTIYVAPSF